jgi:PAS domain S-box-containing protein
MNEREPSVSSDDVVLDRLRRAQTVAHVGSWELDLTTGEMWGSEEAFRIYGLEMPPDQQLPLALVKEVPEPAYRPLLDKALEDLLAGLGPYDVEFEIFRPADAKTRFVHSRAELARGPDGRAIAIVGTLHDVTDRRNMENALRASEERFRMILEHAADAIVLGDSTGMITALNEQACELTGYARDELLGSHVTRLFTHDELVRVPLRFNVIEKGQAVIVERMLRRKDATTIPVEMHSKKLPDGTYQTICRDIRERRKLEEQLRLRQRMDSIGELASGIAHDFNNILVAIVGYTELLEIEGEELSESSREKVRRLLAASRRASDLVGRLQGISHPDRSVDVTFDVHKVASDAVQVLAETTDRRIRVELAVEPGICHVHGGESDIYHALVNLGLNGVQAIEAKGVADGDAVRFEGRPYVAGPEDPHGLAAGEYVEVRVSDTGSGMPPEVKARAFDPLFSTKRRGERKGQGLGLTMVYNTVVTGHGGAIDVETEEGTGTAFRLFLPAAQDRVRDEAEASGSDDDTSRRGTILIIDDEPQILDVARTVLERAGHRVMTASDGVEGLTEFEQHESEIDLLIIDISLPKLSGTDVMREVFRRNPSVGVILSSGNRIEVSEEDKASVRVLPKPYTAGQLTAVVRESLESSEPRA